TAEEWDQMPPLVRANLAKKAKQRRAERERDFQARQRREAGAMGEPSAAAGQVTADMIDDQAATGEADLDTTEPPGQGKGDVSPDDNLPTRRAAKAKGQQETPAAEEADPLDKVAEAWGEDLAEPIRHMRDALASKYEAKLQQQDAAPKHAGDQ